MRPAIDHPERTADDAIAAPVADVVLDVDGADLGAKDRARGTGLEAAGVRAVLADIGEEVPPEGIRGLAELHVSPCRAAEAARIVVGVSRPFEAVLGDVVPLLARHLA